MLSGLDLRREAGAAERLSGGGSLCMVFETGWAHLRGKRKQKGGLI